MRTYDRATIERALSLTREAEYRLDKALTKLSSARNWGIFDILGGGLISTLIKHGKNDEAEQLIREAQRLLGMVQRMIPDAYCGTVETGGHGFARMADVLFDGLVSDLYMQGRIREQQQAVQTLISRVRDLQRELMRCL